MCKLTIMIITRVKHPTVQGDSHGYCLQQQYTYFYWYFLQAMVTSHSQTFYIITVEILVSPDLIKLTTISDNLRSTTHKCTAALYSRDFVPAEYLQTCLHVELSLRLTIQEASIEYSSPSVSVEDKPCWLGGVNILQIQNTKKITS